MAAIGIDLGTTNCCIGSIKNKNIDIIANSNGSRLTPSVISFTRTDQVHVGDIAKENIEQNPENTIYGLKYLIGRTFPDEVLENLFNKFSYSIISEENKPIVYMNEKNFSPEQLSGMILKQLKTDAEKYLDTEVTRAVITVPTYFNDSQRQATIDAGKLAGFSQVMLLNEATAAAIAYGEENYKKNKGKKILVYDFGGGTFDVSVILCLNGKYDVLAIDGDLELGGDVLDELICEYLCNKIRRKYNINKTNNKKFLTRLMAISENVKKELAFKTKSFVKIDDTKNNLSYDFDVTRAEFEEITDHVFKKTMNIVNSCLSKIKLTKSDIDEIVLVGGSSRNACVAKMLNSYFEKEIKESIDPDEAVAKGAAIIASKWTKINPRDISISNFTPYSLGIEIDRSGISNLINKYCKIPSIKTKKIKPATKNQNEADSVRIMAAIGIDLGTTNCCVGLTKNDKIEIIANKNGSRLTPSFISFKNTSQVLVGEPARKNIERNPESTAYGLKYLIGRTINDEIVKNLLPKLSYGICLHENKLKVTLKKEKSMEYFFPEELSGMILHQLKLDAELYLDSEVTAAVITVPTYFNDSQRQATIDAGKLAGFSQVMLLNEATAAAIAYGEENYKKDLERKILVYDFGGGTFDVSVISCLNGKYDVLAIDGDLELGGDMIDEVIYNYLRSKIEEETDVDLTRNKRLAMRLKKTSEDAKKQLAHHIETFVELEGFTSKYVFEHNFTRAKFEEITQNIFKKTVNIVNSCLSKAKLTNKDIDEIVLIGGSSRNACVATILNSYFKKEIKESINPDEAVAKGAAIIASKWTQRYPQDISISNLTPYSLGLK